jgi:hypothetical protein
LRLKLQAFPVSANPAEKLASSKFSGLKELKKP